MSEILLNVYLYAILVSAIILFIGIVYIFSNKINGKGLVYLDSSNSSQKPISVLKSLDYFYSGR